MSKKVPDPVLYEEGKDYELIPAMIVKDEANPDANEMDWYVRILTGNYNETVIQYGTLSEDEENEQLKFDFNVVSTPDPAVTVEDVKLQYVVGDILTSIITRALQEENLQKLQESLDNEQSG